MDDLLKAAAANLDQQLIRVAVALEGSEAGAKQMIDALARGLAHPGSDRFLDEVGAILRVRRLLAHALSGATPSTRPRRFEIIEGGRAVTVPAA
ncbi:MAG: hypothetical protein R3D57_16625 [Hyphomicrobiaceae bacterium]